MRSGRTVCTAPASGAAALDRQLMAADAGDLGAHRDQAGREIGDFGFARRHCGSSSCRWPAPPPASGSRWRRPTAAAAGCRRRCRPLRAVAWIMPPSSVDRRAHGAQPRDMKVDAAQADGVAARQRQARLAAARQQRAEQQDRGAHARHQLRGRCRRGCRRSAEIVTGETPRTVDDQCISQPRRCSSAASTATSRLAGTLRKVTRCGVRSADTINGSTAFLAPLIG